MKFVTNIEGKNIYINKELQPTENIEESIEIQGEYVNLYIKRLKVNDKYLACLNGKIFFSDKNDDATLFILEWGHGYNFYISIENNYLCFDEKIFTCKKFPDVDNYRGNIKFLKLETNIDYI
jgi:hypothetical protein